MAIYVNNLGSGEIPVTLNNPQEGESLIFDESAGAFINAPSTTSIEVIQDTVSEMLEVDPDGSQVSLRLVSNYDDVTGKLTFNVVADGNGGGSGGGSGIAGITVKEGGAARGLATTLDFVGASVAFSNNTATIQGLMDSIRIYNNGVNQGDVKNFNFENLTVTLNNDIVTVAGPDLSIFATKTYVDSAVAGSGSNYVLPTASSSVLGGIKLGTGLTIDGSGLVSVIGGSSGSYVLPNASTSTLGGVKVDGSTILIDANGVISSVGSSGGGITLTDVGAYLTTNGYATQIYVTNQLSNIVDGAPTLLNTLNELAAALNDNPDFATDVLLKTGGTMTGALTLSGAPTTDLHAATKKYVDDSITAIPAPTTTLNDLTDVITTGVTTGQLLGYNGTAWVPTSNSGAKGDTGEAGPQGDTGLSISAATVTLLGRLQLTLTDNSIVDAGNVSGIKTVIVNGSGELVFTKQDNTTINAGSVRGPQGDTGTAATIAVGSVTTGASGSAATVANSGTASAVTLNFSIPQGAKGDTGNAGVGVSSATVNGSGNLIITKTDSSTVDAGSVVGTQGDKGDAGDAGTITINAVATGAAGTDVVITNTGTASAALLNFTIPKGDTGVGVFSAVVNGSGNLILTLDDASTIDAGNTQGPQGSQGSQGAAGLSVTAASVSGDDLSITLSDSTVLNAGNVRGPQGTQGNQGNAGTITVGSATTGAAGSSVVVTNTGTSSAATLNFTIPQGAKGDTGTSYTVNGKAGSVQIYGVQNTTQPGYDLELDLSNKANKLTTARNISLSGKVTGIVSFDGSANVTMTTALNAVTTSDITEGSRLYHTDARSRLALSSTADSNISSLISYDDATGVIKYRASTSYITEGSNLYFTNTRADARADVRIAASSINALSDVDTVTAAPTNGQVLTWTGSAWTPSTVTSGSGAVASVNGLTGAVTLNTDSVSEGSTNQYYTNARWDTRLATKTTDNLTQGSINKYFTDTLARGAFGAGTGISYNSGTGTISLNATSDNVTEGSSNLYYTSARFDTRLGQSNLNQFADVADTTPTSGQALAWNGSAWAPTTISGGGGGSGSSGVYRAAVQVEYTSTGALASVSVLNGDISAVIATATSTIATVTFTFTGSVCAPLNTQIYAYQRTSNVYVATAVTSSFTAGRTLAGGGTSGSPSAFSAFDPAVNTMTIGLTKSITGASAAVGDTTHCVVQFLLSSV